MKTKAQAEILAAHTPELFRAAVDRASELLQAGELVGLPTETVYGLAANAFDPVAVAKIFLAKGRPSHNPIIVHVADEGMARQCVSQWPDTAHELARSFWPGPMTLVLPCSSKIPSLVTAGGDTVGIRWPAHPFVQAVIRQCGFPLAAPSANVSNQVSPTSADHVRRQLGEKIALIVDGGQCQVGIESTVVDLTVEPPAILRPGMVHRVTLESVLGQTVTEELETRSSPQATQRSPGRLPRHYSPTAQLLVLEWRSDQQLLEKLEAGEANGARTWVLAHTQIPSAKGLMGVSVIPHDAEAYARALYAELHRCDENGAGWIVVEKTPDTPEWRGIADRLGRATSK